MDFKDAIRQVIPPDLISTRSTGKGGQTLSYISWATIVGLAKFPEQIVAQFKHNSVPAKSVFGGYMVAIDLKVGDRLQRTWLPILNNNNDSIPKDQVTVRDVSDAINRCRAKAIAMTLGVGLGSFAGFAGRGDRFYAAVFGEVDVDETTDLATVAPMVKEKGRAKFMPWPAAIAAARCTDPNFFWDVVEFDNAVTDANNVEHLVKAPYLRMANGFLVAVRVLWKDKSHVEYLPIKDNLKHQPIANPSADDWNSTVMRALTKAIAVTTGYGISVYAEDELLAVTQQDATANDPGQPQRGPRQAKPSVAPPKTQAPSAQAELTGTETLAEAAAPAEAAANVEHPADVAVQDPVFPESGPQLNEAEAAYFEKMVERIRTGAPLDDAIAHAQRSRMFRAEVRDNVAAALKSMRSMPKAA